MNTSRRTAFLQSTFGMLGVKFSYNRKKDDVVAKVRTTQALN